MKVLLRCAVVLMILALMSIAGCSRTTTPPTPPASTEDPIQASKDAAAFRAQTNAAIKQAQKDVDAIEVRVKAAPTLDARLSIIVTAFCQVAAWPDQGRGQEADAARLLLEQLFNKYWQAGGKWDSPIYVATRQPGGCPAAYPAFSPVPHG